MTGARRWAHRCFLGVRLGMPTALILYMLGAESVAVDTALFAIVAAITGLVLQATAAYQGRD